MVPEQRAEAPRRARRDRAGLKKRDGGRVPDPLPGREGPDLSVRAEDYLRDIGMSEDEISRLKEKLAEDYGGLK